MTKKYKRPFTSTWRWLIAGTSVTAFVGGWAVLAHTPNPYGNTASAETLPASRENQEAPAIEQAPAAPGANSQPFQTFPRNRRQRQFQQLPSQGFDTAPQNQPNLQNQLPTTRVFGQRRMRTGGS